MLAKVALTNMFVMQSSGHNWTTVYYILLRQGLVHWFILRFLG